jgi:hypothetical protein
MLSGVCNLNDATAHGYASPVAKCASMCGLLVTRLW